MGSCASSQNKKSVESKIDIKEANKRKTETTASLTKQDVYLIRKSWKIIVQSGLAKCGTLMMVRVFIEHRELKPLWRFARNLETEDQMNSNATLKAHGEKLFNAIDMAVNSLEDFNTLVPILIQLGYSHYQYGVKEEYFTIIGGILIETLQESLKKEFTPKVKKAWVKAYTAITSYMNHGLRQAEADIKSSKNIIQPVEIHINHVNDVDLALCPNNTNSSNTNNKVFPNHNMESYN